MKSRELDDKSPVRPSGRTPTSEGKGGEESAVVGNERMTALAGAVLLVLILVELVSAAILHTWMSIHIFVGVLLAGRSAHRQARQHRMALLALLHRITRLRTQRSAPHGVAGDGPSAHRYDSCGHRQWNRTRGDRPAFCWPTPSPARLQHPALAPADRSPYLRPYLAGPTPHRRRLERTIQ
jgi:hypothetical protein